MVKVLSVVDTEQVAGGLTRADVRGLFNTFSAQIAENNANDSASDSGSFFRSSATRVTNSTTSTNGNSTTIRTQTALPAPTRASFESILALFS